MVTAPGSINNSLPPAFKTTGFMSTYASQSRMRLTVESSDSGAFRISIRTETVSITSEQAGRFTGFFPDREGLADQSLESILSESDAPAMDLFGDDGFFGVAKTAERIAGFVLNGAGDDAERLRQGREGVLQGFKEAEKIWGGKLPDISYQTLDKALSAIDDKLSSLGKSIIETTA